jgi:hypothetical protein
LRSDGLSNRTQSPVDSILSFRVALPTFITTIVFVTDPSEVIKKTSIAGCAISSIQTE